MGQAALKSRSHRRYYLNKVLPPLSLPLSLFLSSQARRLFLSRASIVCQLTGGRYRCVLSHKSVQSTLFVISTKELGLQVPIDRHVSSVKFISVSVI